jgi:radical SAM superfamily enzyme YgiQ (UPF0313 family)
LFFHALPFFPRQGKEHPCAGDCHILAACLTMLMRKGATLGSTMRVLLIYPYARIDKREAEYCIGSWLEPLALEYLAAAALANDHEAQILDLRDPCSDLTQTLETFQPHVVAITGLTYHVLAIRDIARKIKSLLPTVFVIVGGHHATVMPEDFFCAEIDGIAHGEGVAAFQTLLRGLARQSVPTPIPGLWQRIEGRFVFGGDSPLADLDILPLPDRCLTRRQNSPYFLCDIRPIALMRMSVGCSFRCKFCALWQMNGGKILMHSHARVIDELKKIPEPTVFFADDEPFLQTRRMHELAVEIKRHAIPKTFFSTIRMDTLLHQQDLVARWRDIGLRAVFIGIEAITQERLSSFDKHLTVKVIEQGLRFARELGIEVYAGFIVHTDFRRRDFQELTRFIEHHRITYPMFTIFTPLPSTEYFRMHTTFTSRLPDGRPDWDLFDLQHPVVPTHLPTEVFMHEYRQLQRRFNFFRRPDGVSYQPQGVTESGF